MKKTNANRKPSPNQQAAAEFRREVKDLSTDDLRYRLAQSAKCADDISARIATLQAQLTVEREELARANLERGVLLGLVEGR